MNKLHKETPTQHDISDNLKLRWSPRAFSDKPISKKDMQRLLEAGRWSPSSNNLQPWRIIWAIEGDGVYERIFNCLDDFNQKWAGNAKALMVGAYYKKMDNGKDNFHALHDLGLFMASLTFQATEMGIAVHQMAGINFKKAMDEFNFGEDYHVATGVALGYYGDDNDDLPEDLKKAEKKKRERKLQTLWAFNGNFKE